MERGSAQVFRQDVALFDQNDVKSFARQIQRERAADRSRGESRTVLMDSIFWVISFSSQSL